MRKFTDTLKIIAVLIIFIVAITLCTRMGGMEEGREPLRGIDTEGIF